MPLMHLKNIFAKFLQFAGGLDCDHPAFPWIPRAKGEDCFFTKTPSEMHVAPWCYTWYGIGIGISWWYEV